MSRREEVGQLIRSLRKAQGMTQADLAKKLKQSPSSITMYETGRRIPDLITLEAIADIFNVPFGLLDGPSKEESAVGADDPSFVQINTEEARILAKGFDKMPEADRKRALDMAKLIFEKYADLFEQKGNDDDA